MGKVIGITGQSGAGKTTVTRYFQENGYPVINADLVAREVVKPGMPCMQKLIGIFSDAIILPNGELNRKALGNIVFSDAEKLEQLNAVMHPYILRVIAEDIERYKKNGAEYIILDAPTLFESGADSQCDKIISIIADENKRIERIMKRDSLTKDEALLRIHAQHEDKFYISRSHFIIRNEGNVKQLLLQAKDIMKKIKENMDAERSY